jgi:putative spermidine/putrescine transport system ATP-binding protein
MVSGKTAEVLGVHLPLVDETTSDGPAIAIVRPEAFTLAGTIGDTSLDAPLAGTVIATAFLGAVSRITVDLGGGLTVMAQLPTSEASAYPAGTAALLHLRTDAVLVTREAAVVPAPGPAAAAVENVGRAG